MAAEMEAEEARIGRRQRGKREERRRESKCAKNAFIVVEWCDAGERCDLFLFSLPPNYQMTSPKTLLK
jgi:hypothetical protein